MIDVQEHRANTSRDGAIDEVNVRPKMLFLIDEMAAITAGGTERQLLQLVEIAFKNGVDTQICVLRGTGWLTPQIAGCNVKHFDITRICSFAGLRSICELTRWMREEQFHIVQTFFSESNLLGPWTARVAKVPIVLGTRRNLNHPVQERRNRFGLSIQWVSNLLVDQIIANSEAVLEKVANSEWLSRSKLSVIHNGIDPLQMRSSPNLREDTRHRLGIDPDQILVCNISGLRPIKGVELFVQAAALAAGQDPRLRFALVGDGELRDAIAQSVAQYRLDKVFHLVGPAADVRPFLAATDIAVLCSLAEGFSNSLLEYMAAGLPIIATDVGGNREALGGAGVLIEPNNAHALSHAVLSMLDLSIRKQQGAAALQEVQRFDLRHAEARMGEIYWRHLRRVLKLDHNAGKSCDPGISPPLAAGVDPTLRAN
jgi:glycosyltransferase involved in cell wall biosynthesis